MYIQETKELRKATMKIENLLKRKMYHIQYYFYI